MRERISLRDQRHGTAQSLSAAHVRVCSQSGNCLCNQLDSGIRIDGPVIQDDERKNMSGGSMRARRRGQSRSGCHALRSQVAAGVSPG